MKGRLGDLEAVGELAVGLCSRGFHCGGVCNNDSSQGRLIRISHTVAVAVVKDEAIDRCCVSPVGVTKVCFVIDLAQGAHGDWELLRRCGPIGRRTTRRGLGLDHVCAQRGHLKGIGAGDQSVAACGKGEERSTIERQRDHRSRQSQLANIMLAVTVIVIKDYAGYH